MPRLQLHIVLYHGLKIGTPEVELARVLQSCQRPLIEALERHPELPCALHMTGPSLEWLDRHEEGLADRLFALCSEGTLELIGGGFYAPILSLLPWRDAIGQLEMMAGYIDRHTGQRPEGGWLERRVWEPRLAEVLADGGVRYTFLEEHQLREGGARGSLRRLFVTEHVGRPLALLPIDAELSRLALVGHMDALQSTLRRYAREVGSGDRVTLALPLPRDYCQSVSGAGLEGLLEAIDSLRDVLDVCLPREVLQQRDPPPERIYVPSSAGSLVGPGLWQRWLARHDTADRLHKRMVDVSRRVAALERVVRNQGWQAMSQLSRLRRRLFRAQTAQAYAAGEGGGLMTPEVRAVAWRNLIEAERSADVLVRGEVDFLEVSLRDLYANLGTVVLLRNRFLRVVLRPERGGALAELEQTSSGTALTDVLAPGVPISDEAWEESEVFEVGALSVLDSLHPRFVSVDTPIAAWLDGVPELSDLSEARFRLISVDSVGRAAEERAHVVLSGQGTLQVDGLAVGVSLLQHLRLGAQDEALSVRLELHFDRPLPLPLHFALTSHFNLQPSDMDACGVEVDGAPARHERLDAFSSDEDVRRVALFNRDLGLRVCLSSELPVIVERAPVYARFGERSTAPLQGTALALRLPLEAGTEAIDWALRLDLSLPVSLESI